MQGGYFQIQALESSSIWILTTPGWGRPGLCCEKCDLKEKRRGPTPQREPMGLCFSGPKDLTPWLHSSHATPVSDVSLASGLAPRAFSGSIRFRGGNL